ncbi:hypothetical protein GCM10023085_38990 [Actinomadura viridis]|uniref:Uncharacterized protein n=1 Tax=Actinomadura viridis TaxID=58110 RepID=A0A931DUA0_9ACTN|nr:hypothetical protein [Actinomadura viridis]MBG6092813.1 hypothetical protein [Actinomadura viridis]
MTARVTTLRARPRPRRPGSAFSSRPVPAGCPASSWASSAVPPVILGWDDVRGLHIARCERCADSFASDIAGEVEDWAELHRCDAELAALLALVTSGRAA